MDGLGRRDLLLRGSPFWRCGKCDFERNFSHRTKCHQCGQRPPQWILDAQASKVRELSKAGGKSGAPARAGAGGSAASAPSQQEVDKLRAEVEALKKAAAAAKPAQPQSEENSKDDNDAKDQEYQAVLEDFLKQARAHHDVINRFGRFPQRNELLRRESSPDEAQYLRRKSAKLQLGEG